MSGVIKVKKTVGVITYSTSEGEFYFINFGSEVHGKPSFKLWVSKKLVFVKDGKHFIAFPVQKARIHKTTKGSLVMRPDDNWTVHYVFVPSGYRGGAEINIIQPTMAEMFNFQEYRSPLGACGKSTGALVNVPIGAILKYGWYRWGRLYGSPKEGVSEVLPNGEERTLTMVTVDDLKEIKSMTN